MLTGWANCGIITQKRQFDRRGKIGAKIKKYAFFHRFYDIEKEKKQAVKPMDLVQSLENGSTKKYKHCLLYTSDVYKRQL